MTLAISITQSRRWRGESACRRAWWYRHVAHATPSNPKSSRQVAGIVRHAGIEAAYRTAAALTEHDPRVSLYEVAGQAALAAMEAYREQLGPEWDEIAGQVLDLLDAIPAPSPASVLAVEEPFSIVRHGVTITGVWDLVLRLGPAWLHIRDWKTSAPKSKRAVAMDEQLAIQQEAAREVWPWATDVTVGLYGIRKRYEEHTRLSPERISEVVKAVCEDAEEIDDALAAAGRETPAEVFPVRMGEHCSTCEFRTYCPAWNHVSAPLSPAVNSETVNSIGHSLEKILNPVLRNDNRELP